MSLFNIFNNQPGHIAKIIDWINSFFHDVGPEEVTRRLRQEAIFYAENQNNRQKIESGLNDGKTAEYFALIFIYLGTKDVLSSGVFHVYAGMPTAEGFAAGAVAKIAWID